MLSFDRKNLVAINIKYSGFRREDYVICVVELANILKLNRTNGSENVKTQSIYTRPVSYLFPRRIRGDFPRNQLDTCTSYWVMPPGSAHNPAAGNAVDFFLASQHRGLGHRSLKALASFPVFSSLISGCPFCTFAILFS
jgi:hypothetical protein